MRSRRRCYHNMMHVMSTEKTGLTSGTTVLGIMRKYEKYGSWRRALPKSGRRAKNTLTPSLVMT
jgi:hypothetical protein